MPGSRAIIVVFLWFVLPLWTLALAAPVTLPEAEFVRLASDLAPKVNLFREVWERDPDAEVFGGTSRDFLFWVKGQLAKGKTPAELRALPVIDVREFIIGESDVDVISRDASFTIDVRAYGIRKIDFVGAARLDPATELGKTERRQGYLPMEKIRLGRKGLIQWNDFGDGIGELLRGVPTAHFADQADFEATHYAKLGLNHPMLLALRYLRLTAMCYFHDHGKGLPDASLLRLDPVSERAVRDVVAAAARDGKLAELLKLPDFKRKFGDTVQKVFRSYTNPTAANLLFKHFGLDEMWKRVEGIPPYNQYLFQKYRDPKAVAANLQEYGVDAKRFYRDPSREFPGLELYHGTRGELAFRAILFQGVLPSEKGSAGSGLYGVPADNLAFAVDWAKDADRVVAFSLSPSTRVVDITEGEGKRVFEAFGRSESEFAEAFGIDVLRYPYHTKAYVVKNGAVLDRVRGHTRELLPLSRLIAAARETRGPDALVKLWKTLEINGLSAADRIHVLTVLPDSKLGPALESLRGENIDDASKSNLLEIALSTMLLKEISGKPEHRELAEEIQGQRDERLVTLAFRIKDRKEGYEPLLSTIAKNREVQRQLMALVDFTLTSHEAERSGAERIASDAHRRTVKEWARSWKWIPSLLKGGGIGLAVSTFGALSGDAQHRLSDPMLVGLAAAGAAIGMGLGALKSWRTFWIDHWFRFNDKEEHNARQLALNYAREIKQWKAARKALAEAGRPPCGAAWSLMITR